MEAQVVAAVMPSLHARSQAQRNGERRAILRDGGYVCQMTAEMRCDRGAVPDWCVGVLVVWR